MSIVLATICCRFWSWGLIKKLNFCFDFEHKGWSRFWSWSSARFWNWSLFSILPLMFWRGYEVESLLILLPLLMLMMRTVLTTVCCRFGSWWLFIKLNFCSDFEHNVWSRFFFKVWIQAKFEAGVWSVLCCWCFVEVMKLNLGQDSGQDFEF